MLERSQWVPVGTSCTTTHVLTHPCFSLSWTVYNQNFWNQTKSFLARMSGETASQSNRKQKMKMFTTMTQEYWKENKCVFLLWGTQFVHFSASHAYCRTTFFSSHTLPFRWLEVTRPLSASYPCAHWAKCWSFYRLLKKILWRTYL